MPKKPQEFPVKPEIPEIKPGKNIPAPVIQPELPPEPEPVPIVRPEEAPIPETEPQKRGLKIK